MKPKPTTPAVLLLLPFLLSSVCPAAPFDQNQGAAITGTLRDEGQPVNDAALILQSFKDENCAKLFEEKKPMPGDQSKLQKCSRDLPEQRPDAEGGFRFENITPGWYAFRFLWNIRVKPAQFLTPTLDKQFVIFYAGHKDSTGRYDTMAQGRPFYFAGREDVTIQFDYRSPAQPPKPIEQTNRGRISLQNKTWGVVLSLPGFEVKTSETRFDGRRYFLAENKDSCVIVSVFLEEADPGGKVQTCRENLAERLKSPAPYSRKDSKLYEKGEMTVLEFVIPEAQGVKLRQKNLFACLFRDNVYIDFHFSKTDYQANDERKFWEILDTMQFQENIPRTSMDYLQVGSLYYIQRNYNKAIPSYEQALALERQNRSLEKKWGYVLVDNLGMAYGVTGQLQKAKEIFEYGISLDPTYPLFYYNLACTYAEMNDIANAKTYLTKAFQYKQNTIPGEGMPDPRNDDSFKRFLKDKEFKKFLDDLMGS